MVCSATSIPNTVYMVPTSGADGCAASACIQLVCRGSHSCHNYLSFAALQFAEVRTSAHGWAPPMPNNCLPHVYVAVWEASQWQVPIAALHYTSVLTSGSLHAPGLWHPAHHHPEGAHIAPYHGMHVPSTPKAETTPPLELSGPHRATFMKVRTLLVVLVSLSMHSGR